MLHTKVMLVNAKHLTRHLKMRLGWVRQINMDLLIIMLEEKELIGYTMEIILNINM
jgi:hypothetical protein